MMGEIPHDLINNIFAVSFAYNLFSIRFNIQIYNRFNKEVIHFFSHFMCFRNYFFIFNQCEIFL